MIQEADRHRQLLLRVSGGSPSRYASQTPSQGMMMMAVGEGENKIEKQVEDGGEKKTRKSRTPAPDGADGKEILDEPDEED